MILCRIKILIFGQILAKSGHHGGTDKTVINDQRLKNKWV